MLLPCLVAATVPRLTGIDSSVEAVVVAATAMPSNFALSSDLKGNDIRISGLTATMKTNLEHQSVLATSPLRSGLHHWEVILERFMSNEIYIGVALPSVSKNQCPRFEPGWWFLSGSGAVGGDETAEHAFGDMLQEGDTVGVHLDMDQHTLSFSVNGEKTDVHITVPASDLYPAVCLYSLVSP